MNIKCNGPIPYNGHNPTVTTATSSRPVVLIFHMILPVPNNRRMCRVMELNRIVSEFIDLLLADLNQRLADRRVTVVLDQKAKEWAAEKGYVRSSVRVR